MPLRIALLGLVAAGIGVLTAVHAASDQVPAPPADHVLLSLAHSEEGSVVESGAGEGPVLVHRRRSRAEGDTVVTPVRARIVVRARGDHCDGPPVMRVSVDGQVVLTAPVEDDMWRDYTATTTTPAGPARVSVEFTNDLSRPPSCDRNLYTGPVTFVHAGSATAALDGHLAFDADVAQRGLSEYASVIHPERIAIVDDPVLGEKRQVMRFTVYDGDTGPTEHPRAQVETPRFLGEGDEVWIGWSTLFPSDWPKQLPEGGRAWLTLSEIYGPPFDGASPVKIGMRSGTRALTWQRNDTYEWDVPWEQGPIAKNRWYDFVLHVKLSRNDAQGFVELYVDSGDGWEKQKVGSTRRLATRTLDNANNGGANYHKLALYRMRGMFDVLTIYHAEHRVGDSFSAVAPRSHA